MERMLLVIRPTLKNFYSNLQLMLILSLHEIQVFVLESESQVIKKQDKK